MILTCSAAVLRSSLSGGPRVEDKSALTTLGLSRSNSVLTLFLVYVRTNERWMFPPQTCSSSRFVEGDSCRSRGRRSIFQNPEDLHSPPPDSGGYYYYVIKAAALNGPSRVLPEPGGAGGGGGETSRDVWSRGSSQRELSVVHMSLS